MTVREQLKHVYETLPEDAQLEEAIDRLILLNKIEEGAAQIDAGKEIAHEDVKRQLLEKWSR